MPKKILCFLCKKNITKESKIISYHNFPDKLWNEVSSDWARNFTVLFNGVLCSACAREDLAIAHEKIIVQKEIQNGLEKIRNNLWDILEKIKSLQNEKIS